MSNLIETTALHHGNLFEVFNGSVYRAEAQADHTGPLQAPMVCASSRSRYGISSTD